MDRVRRVCTLIGMVAIAATGFQAFSQERQYSIMLFGGLTTSSKLFHHPNDPDELLRSQFFPFENIFSAGIDARRNFEDLGVQIGLNVEYISKNTTSSIPAPAGTVQVTDGLIAFPVELTGYFYIPVGSDRFHVYMGGGTGAYIGSRTYEYAGAVAQTVERTAGFGIHILSGVEYDLTPEVSLRSEIKFRDVQFETVNRFTQFAAFDQGSTLTLDQDPLPSRINIDGMHLSLGIAFHL